MCTIVPDYLCRRVSPPAQRLAERDTARLAAGSPALEDLNRRGFLKLAAAAAVALAAPPAWAQGAKVEVHWLGQAATKITTLTGKVIVIDPFLTNNPKTPPALKSLDALGKVDVILVTHGHGDHVGDVKDLAARTGATVLGPAGLIATLTDLGWIAPDKGVRFGKGGRVTPAGPGIRITQTRAEHSSEVTVVDPVTKKSVTYPGGEPAGFIIECENGFKIYHMGDTGLFGDMRLIGEYYKPDLAMIPIGGHFVMDPVDAAFATKEMIRPKFAIPFHYGTIPVLRGTPQEYQAALGQTSTQVFPISPGDKLTF
jgi:L-ascorbate metabolism protein UlaG (beta-lactamase superfamily)